MTDSERASVPSGASGTEEGQVTLMAEIQARQDAVVAQMKIEDAKPDATHGPPDLRRAYLEGMRNALGDVIGQLVIRRPASAPAGEELLPKHWKDDHTAMCAWLEFGNVVHNETHGDLHDRIVDRMDRLAAAIWNVAALHSRSPEQSVTRFELIDHRESSPPQERGRLFVLHDCALELVYQDAGRTLKVFLTDPSAPNSPEKV